MKRSPSNSVTTLKPPVAPVAADILKECNNTDVYEELEVILDDSGFDSTDEGEPDPEAGDVIGPSNGGPTAGPPAEEEEEEEDEEMTEEQLFERIKDQIPSEEEVQQMTAMLKERGIIAFLQEYVVIRRVPVTRLLLAFGVLLTPESEAMDEILHLRLLKAALTKILRKREKLPEYNTVDDVVSLLRRSTRIMVLTGAGISVSCGIPDFRSRDGIYSMLADKPELQLDDPQQMFDIEYFKDNPAIFFSFASHIYPSNFKPSPCHHFIKLLEDKNKLLRNYTQNIDTLEHAAGVRKVLQCHGSFATATCVQCGLHVPGDAIRDDILAQRIPYCHSPVCAAPSAAKVGPVPKPKKKKVKNAKPWEVDEDETEGLPQITLAPGVMKPDITFFGEKLSDDFDKLLFQDREHVDLLLIMGTSLAVAPVADVLAYIPHSIPQVLINKTPVIHANPDVTLLGDADTIVQHLCEQLSWSLPGSDSRKRPAAAEDPRRVRDTHVWLFDGAEGGRYVKHLEDGLDPTGLQANGKRLRVV